LDAALRRTPCNVADEDVFRLEPPEVGGIFGGFFVRADVEEEDNEVSGVSVTLRKAARIDCNSLCVAGPMSVTTLAAIVAARWIVPSKKLSYGFIEGAMKRYMRIEAP
jgi:hypothetical protein